MQTRLPFLLSLLGAAAFIVGCSSEPQNKQTADTMTDSAKTTVQKFEDKDPSLQNVLSNSAGYAAFPSVGKGGFIVGAAYGKGTVFERGHVVGYADMKQGSVGLQAGGEDYAELIVFRDQASLDKFRTGNYALSAEASAVALKAGAAANADFKEGVAVFTMTNSGLMAEAAVAGQKFGYTPKDQVGNGHTETTETHTTTTTQNP
ncbi:MAG TPA: lipid-binding SYLF domain-containing protein [Bryobacteraceae bacterium]